jgi:hypothetical protein
LLDDTGVLELRITTKFFHINSLTLLVFSIFLSLFSPTLQSIAYKCLDTLTLVEGKQKGKVRHNTPFNSVASEMSHENPLNSQRAMAEGNDGRVLNELKVDDFRNGQIDHAQLT